MKKKVIASIILIMLVSCLFLTGCFEEATENKEPNIDTLTAVPNIGITPLLVSFSADANDSDGTIEKYEWDFDDGSDLATGSVVSHEYITPGIYKAKLTVTDDDGATTSETIEITVNEQPQNQLPEADFSYEYISPRNYQFTDLSSDSDGEIVDWFWSFGDGNTSTEQNPTYEYNETGLFSVDLIVTDNDGGGDTFTTDIDVEDTEPVENDDPVAVIDVDKTTGDSPLTVSFESLSTDDGVIVLYEWDFDDGSTSTEQNPTYEFINPGNYTVALTVTDDDGATNSTAIEIIVTEGEINADVSLYDLNIFRNDDNFLVVKGNITNNLDTQICFVNVNLTYEINGETFNLQKYQGHDYIIPHQTKSFEVIIEDENALFNDIIVDYQTEGCP